MNYHLAKLKIKSVEKQKSYRSLKLHFFPKKGGKTDKTQIISLGINNFK